MRTFSRTTALTRFAIAIALACVLVGCALDDDPGPGTGTSAPTSTPTTPEPAATGTAAPGASPTPSDPPGGSGDGDEDDKPATAGGGICNDLEDQEVGGVLGGTVLGAGLAPSGCEFHQASGRAPAATFVEASYARTAGGMDGAKSNATASVEGEPEDLTGIGTAAFVVTGTVFGGEDVQGAGAVRIGDRLIEITLSQRQGVSAAKVRALVIGLLELVADQAA